MLFPPKAEKVEPRILEAPPVLPAMDAPRQLPMAASLLGSQRLAITTSGAIDPLQSLKFERSRRTETAQLPLGTIELAHRAETRRPRPFDQCRLQKTR